MFNKILSSSCFCNGLCSCFAADLQSTFSIFTACGTHGGNETPSKIQMTLFFKKCIRAFPRETLEFLKYKVRTETDELFVAYFSK